MKVAIDRIIVGERFRKRITNIESLAASIQEHGLLHPVVIDHEFRLVAGQRRLLACKSLGWKAIEVRFLDIEHMAYAQRDENVQREPFAPSEAVQIYRHVEVIEKKAAKERMSAGGMKGKPGKKSKERCANFAHLSASKTRQSAAEAAGLSYETLRKAAEVVDAVREDPEKYGDIVEEMDKTGNVHAAYVELKRRRAAQEADRMSKSAKRSIQHKLFLADSMGMISDASVDLVCTDPPYNISRDRVVEFAGRKAINHDYGAWDRVGDLYLPKAREWCAEFFRVLRDGGSAYVFCAERGISFMRGFLIGAGFRYKNTLVWKKTNPKPKPDKTSYIAACDFICFAVKGEGHTFNWTNLPDMLSEIEHPGCGGKERRDHPTQKPLAVIEKLIRTSSNPGDTVLDAFAGSGTTGEACQRLKRRFILIEKEQEYIKIIESRTGVQHETTL